MQNLTYESLISLDLFSHTKEIIIENSSEELTYYIDNTNNVEYLDLYTKLNERWQVNRNYIAIQSRAATEEEKEFIKSIFTRLDKIIDLDFRLMSTNNGSIIDIYGVLSSSSFISNDVIGQALKQDSIEGKWWDIFWSKKFSPLEFDNNERHTIIHEIGHALGLAHPDGNPTNKSINTQDTVMSYNKGDKEWGTWFSEIDIKALKSMWGRENDEGFITLEKEKSNYKFKRNGDNYSIKTNTGQEDISNLDYLLFSDSTLQVERDIKDTFGLVLGVDDITGKVYRLYNTAFGRFPDYNGLNYWISNYNINTFNFDDICKSFLLSDEFERLYPSTNSNEEFLNALYSNVLNREPDIDGFNYWSKQINSGIDSRSNTLISFSESYENKVLFSEETGISIG